ncbi:MAG: polysaccharide biosynthesis C-terminal domain-containing protein [Leadbetterella sp.]|nr:polysaccharide biosynthesis C-terminal domain-containing protein [Leadbetterella sp.]
MSFLKKLAGDAVLYGMSTIVGRLLNWLMMAVHTRAFEEPKMLAENGLLYTYMIPLNILFTFGMETAFFRYASKKEDQAEYFNLILTFILIFGSTLSALFIFFATPISLAFNFPHTEHLITLLAIILLTDSVCAIAFVKLRANNQAKKFVVIKLSNILINVFVTLFFIYFCHNIVTNRFFPELKPFISRFYSVEKGPDFIIYANYVASLLTLLMLWKEFVGFRLTWIWEKLKLVLEYAWPLMIMGLAGSINLTADRLLFRELLPQGFYPAFPDVDTAFGIYTNVYKLSIFMTLVVQAYRYAAEPLFFSKMGDRNSPRMIALSTKWFTLACIFIWVFVSLNLNWISLIPGEGYRQREGLLVVPVLLLANLFIGLYGNLTIWFKLSDKTYYGTYITIGAMVVTVLLNMLLIPRLGFMGCAVSFAVSSFLMVASCYILGEKHYPIPYETGRVLFYLAVAALIIWGYSFVDNRQIMRSLLLQGLLCAMFVALIYGVEKKRPANG